MLWNRRGSIKFGIQPKLINLSFEIFITTLKVSWENPYLLHPFPKIFSDPTLFLGGITMNLIEDIIQMTMTVYERSSVVVH